MPDPILRPMKGVKIFDFEKLRYPVLATPKIDGIRCLVVEGKALTASLKPQPNLFIRNWVEKNCHEGFDGELSLHGPRGKEHFGATSSAILSRGGEPDFRYEVFDWLGESADDAYENRIGALDEILDYEGIRSRRLTSVIPTHIMDPDHLEEFEKLCLEQGYEGAMVRSPYGPYKFGKATLREQYLLKIKRFDNREAVVVGVVEQMHNANPAEVSELGLTKRSSHKANKIPMGRLGAFVVRDCKTNVEFEIGTGDGLTHLMRDQLWRVRDLLPGKIVKYRCQAYGGKDKPRIPVWTGWRSSLPEGYEG